jgi:spore germination protein KA
MAGNSIWKKAAKFLIFREIEKREGFILSGTEDQTGKQDGAVEKTPAQQKRTPKKRPRKLQYGVNKKQGNTDNSAASDKKTNKKTTEEHTENTDLKSLLVDRDLAINKACLEKIYKLPKNKDIIIREFAMFSDAPRKALIIFIEGISDRKTINENVLKPLMLLTGRQQNANNNTDIIEYIKAHIIYGNQADVHDTYEDIIEKVNFGGTAVFVDGCPACLVVETKGWDRRSIGKPETEQVILGPHEAFNETLRSNTALLRKAIRNSDLITEMFKIGERNKTDIAVMYLEGLVNPSLVEEVKRRISSISTDYVGGAGILEQFIEDNPYVPIPQVLFTERPDRAASFIMDGKVAIILDGNPHAIIVPVTFFALMHSPEDYYLRITYANFVRLLRVVAIFIAIMTPGIYVAITTFHQEMIPTDLILAISAARETVPFPTIVEVFLMEFAFEMIREAGVRVPGVIGNTIGIVGALILGQAAVSAGIVSPILIIVVAVTGLASFAIPNYSMSFAFRGVRFVFTALAAMFGFFGITAGLFILLTSMSGMKSFGVPLLAPIGPRTKAGPDIVLRGPVWSMEERPDFLETIDRKRQPDISRGWVKPLTGKSAESGDKDEQDS